MTKPQFYKLLSERTGVAIRDVKLIFDEGLILIQLKTDIDEKIALRGFGVFQARIRKSTSRIIPNSGGKRCVIQPRRVLTFRAYRKLSKINVT